MVSRSKYHFAYFHSFCADFFVKFHTDAQVSDLHFDGHKYLKTELFLQDS